jgi:hypothetical protein
MEFLTCPAKPGPKRGKNRREVMQMKTISWWIAIPILIVSVLMMGTLEAQVQKPNFSGIWTLDLDKSDDWAFLVRAAAGNTKSFTKMDVQRIVDRLTYLARTNEEIEIEQSEKEFKTFDKDDNVLIYYLDGKKHTRQTPWGAMLQTLADWNGDELIIVTEGKDIGKVTEVYAYDGEQLVFVIQLELKDFEENVVARYIYNRKDSE